MSIFRKGNVRLAMQSIGSSKGRSFLTMLGIIIGVASVIVVVGIGEGVRNQLNSQIAHLGKNVIAVQPKSEHQNAATGGFVGGTSRPLAPSDIDVIERTSETDKTVPLASATGAVVADRTVDNPTIIATTPEFQDILRHPIAEGGFFDPEPDSRTAVLGPRIAQRLFEDNMPLGQSFRFRGENFLVAGVYRAFPASPLTFESNYNDTIFIPYTTARSVLGTDPATYQILTTPKPDIEVHLAADRIQSNLVSAHGGAHDVLVQPVSEARATQDPTLDLITKMTVGVALIAFVLGGVGIMNVMLVSVSERTQEVGIRKAIGASNQQIMRQFVVEAFMLSVIGAVVGAAVGLATIGLMRLYTNLQPIPAWEVVGVSIVVAVLSGVFFGTFPAVKAASKDPIEALRHQ